MSKSGEETSFIKLNDYTKRERERLLTFAAARQRGEIRQINLKASLFLSFFFFSVSTSQFRDVRLYIIFFLVSFSNERKKIRRRILQIRQKVCLFRNKLLYYSSPFRLLFK